MRRILCSLKRRLERTVPVIVTTEPVGNNACISAVKLATNSVEFVGIVPVNVCRYKSYKSTCGAKEGQAIRNCN